MDSEPIVDRKSAQVSAGHVIGKWFAGGFGDIEANVTPIAASKEIPQECAPQAVPQSNGEQDHHVINIADPECTSAGTAPGSATTQPLQMAVPQSNGVQDHHQRISAGTTLGGSTTQPLQMVASAETTPGGSTTKPLQMVNGQDVIGMLDQMLTEKFESQRLYIAEVLTRQSARDEHFTSEEFKTHRGWCGDNFERLLSTLDKVDKRNFSDPSEGLTPQIHLSQNGTVLEDTGGAATLETALQIDSNETLGSSEVEEVGEIREETASALVANRKPEAKRRKSQNGPGSKVFHSEASSDFRSERKVFDSEASSDCRAERQKMESHLARMATAEQKASINFGFLLDKIGCDSKLVKRLFPKPDHRLVHFVEHGVFSFITMSVILLNAAWIGFQTDQGMKRLLRIPQEFEPGWYVYVDRTFLALFVLDLGLRILAFKRYFLGGHDWSWNFFDASLVLLSLLEEFMASVSVSHLRSLRALRLARMLRIVRVLRFFVGLRQILLSIIGCAYVLLWASFCIVCLMYLFAILLLQAAMSGSTQAEVAPMKKHYPDLVSTMYTLLLAISNGAPWEQLADELGQVFMWFKPVFALYVIFVMFGILNIVNGVFVQKTAELNVHDRDLAVLNQINTTSSFVKDMRALFEMSGCDDLTELTLEEFKHNLDDHDVQMYLQTHGLDATEAVELFLLLDVDQSGTLNMEEFAYGCQRLKQNVKSLDIVRICDRVKTINTKLWLNQDQNNANYRAVAMSVKEVVTEMQQVRTEMYQVQVNMRPRD